MVMGTIELLIKRKGMGLLAHPGRFTKMCQYKNKSVPFSHPGKVAGWRVLKLKRRGINAKAAQSAALKMVGSH